MSRLLDEVSSLRKKLKEAHVPPEMETRVSANLEEIERLEHDISARVHIEQMLRYIDWVVNLPWDTRSKDELDLPNARKILEQHNYGLQPVKERILEYLAIIKLNQERWAKELGAQDSREKEAKTTHAMLA